MRRRIAAGATLVLLGWLSSRAAPTDVEARAASASPPAVGVTSPARAATPSVLPVRLAADLVRDLTVEERVRAAERAAAVDSSRDELWSRVRGAPESLGSLSIGRANRGALFNAVAMPEGPLWHLAEPDKAWGTEETVRGLEHAIGRVNEVFVDSPPLWIGHISRRTGGWLRPHRSHQNGRDVDLGFYYSDDSHWYARGTAKNLDLPRNWVLLETLLRETDVELVFLDRTVQALLVDYALATGSDPEWIDAMFEGERRRSQCTVRHEWGHATHMHIRFHSQVSRDLAARVHPLLMEARLAPRVHYYR